MNDAMVTLEDIREAAGRIRPLARVTPLLTVDDGGGTRPLALKCENLQRSGAFKIRGAANMLLQLTPGSANAASSPSRRATTASPCRSPRHWSAARPSS